MNEFIAQFILESRDFIEQAAKSLAALERTADDAEALDAAFRAFHTLKGGAGIVDFTAMERAVHAAEDVLSRARSGSEPLTRDHIEGCFACLDQASRWLDRMERSGELPTNADAEANEIIDRIENVAQANRTKQARIVPASVAWANALLASNAELRATARTALRFAPRAASFFQGVDPLVLIASVPALLWLDAEPVDGWPTLEALDPFESILAITALSAATAAEVSSHLREHAGECEIVMLQPQAAAAATGSLSVHARRLIEAQLDLLSDVESRTLTGRMTSAGIVVANVLSYCGESASAELVRRALDTSTRDGDPQALVKQIAAVLAPEQPSSGVAVADAPPQPEVSIARTLRVDAERVDALVRLTGELTVVKNAIGHAVKTSAAESSSPGGSLKDHHAALEHLVGELQRAVLAIRVLPLRVVLQRFPRVVREISASLQRSVNVVIEGEETEADKAIVEMLFEPLLHVVRNAIDHGVEESSVRTQRGKPPAATIRLRASRQTANVLIEVEDDGGGIDPARVRRVALDRGIVTEDGLRAMTDSEMVDLVFVPGFSTASDVTQLSGRGVGMDAVRTAVERIGGRVAIESRLGAGTSVKLMLPFSVMMTHVMTVEAGGQMFGIPLDAVVETIRVPTEAIAGVGAARAIVHRNRTTPVFDLANLLRVQESAYTQTEATLVIAAVAGHMGAIQVDRIGERMEVMLKPLEGLLAGLPELTGTTILGDGRVLLVLDLAGVLQ